MKLEKLDDNATAVSGRYCQGQRSTVRRVRHLSRAGTR